MESIWWVRSHSYPSTHLLQPPQQRSSPHDNLLWPESHFLVMNYFCIWGICPSPGFPAGPDPPVASWALGLGLKPIWNLSQIIEARGGQLQKWLTQFAKGKKSKPWCKPLTSQPSVGAILKSSAGRSWLQLHLSGRVEVRFNLSDTWS